MINEQSSAVIASSPETVMRSRSAVSSPKCVADLPQQFGADFINRVLVATWEGRASPIQTAVGFGAMNCAATEVYGADPFEKSACAHQSPHGTHVLSKTGILIDVSNPRGTVYAAADIFYVLPRLLRPTVLVETGVAAGSTTAFLLAAMRRSLAWPPWRRGDMGCSTPNSILRWVFSFLKFTWIVGR